jgi:hypothetical protein
LGHLPIRRNALQSTYIHRVTASGGADAGALTQNFGGADAGATAAENIRIEDFIRRTAQVSGADAANEARNINAGRAGFDARRIIAKVTAIGGNDCLGGVKRRVRIGEIGVDLVSTQSGGGGCIGHGTSLGLAKISPEKFFASIKNLTARSILLKILASGAAMRRFS